MSQSTAKKTAPKAAAVTPAPEAPEKAAHAVTPTWTTWKGAGNPSKAVYYGNVARAAAAEGTLVNITVEKGLLHLRDAAGAVVQRVGTASKFWLAPVSEEAPVTKTSPAKATPAKATPAKATPAKAPVPTSLKEMTREQKRAVAALLIRQAGALAAEWSTARQSTPELAGDLEGVSAKLAGELIGSWLSYCPGTVWHSALGERPRGGK